VAGAEAVWNDITFTGREYDFETGLLYLRARYYDPEAGRFVSKDPIGFAGGDVNLYGYVLGNPVNWGDPLGLLTSVGALAHYLSGSGTPLDMRFNEINTTAMKPINFSQVLSELVHGGCDRTINIDETKIFATSGDAALFLGSIALRLQGTLTISNGTWAFMGNLSASPDKYDFNASNHRTYAGEFSTTVGRYLPGTPYRINVNGEKVLTQNGRIRY
jgi:RHS repeat-associated protein